jgi:O-antigen/teichoic acid export membrane protein
LTGFLFSGTILFYAKGFPHAMQIKSSLAVQVLVALVTLAQNLILIRMAEPQGYGFFVFISAVALFFSVMQNALVSSQMSVLLPRFAARGVQERLCSGFALANAGLTVLAALSASLAALVMGFVSWLEGFAAAMFVAAWLTREFVRVRDFSVFTGGSALRREAGIAGATLLATIGLWFVLQPAQAILLGGALGTFLVFPALKGALPHFSRSSLLVMRALYRRHKSPVLWALLGAFLNECQQRAYVLATQMMLGLAALASVQAGRIPFGPLNIVFNGFGRAARPVYARQVAEGQTKHALHKLSRHLALLLGVNTLAATGLFVLWPLVDRIIFAAKYPDIERYVIAWGMMLLVFQLRSTVGLFFQAQLKFSLLAKVNGWATLLCLGVLCLLMLIPDPMVAIASIIAAETLSLVILSVLLLKETVTIRRMSLLPAQMRS